VPSVDRATDPKLARWAGAAKVGLGALGVYVSSRVLHRFAKVSALGAAVGALCFHRELALSLVGSDRVTGVALGVLYDQPPEKPPVSHEIVELGVPGEARVLREPLLGFAIDTSQVVGGRWWSRDGSVEIGRGSHTTEPFDFSRPELRRLARALGPARLRIGGTEADHVFYSDEARAAAELPAGYEYAFTRAHWDGLVGFVRDVGYSLMFTVNAGPGPRDSDGVWHDDNARRVLGFARDNPAPDTVWELGNEVNGYWFIHGWSHRVSGEAYARDFRQFRALVKAEFPAARVAGPAGFLWPVMGEPFGSTLGVFEGYLKAGGSSADIVTWHYYPQQSRRCPMATRRAAPTTLLHPGFLDETEARASELEGLVRRYAPQAELWLGETGNAQCGGEPGVSDRFASSLWYLDQFGALGRRGQPMIRQTLVGSHYGLLDPDTLEPRPDYWAALLARRLVSGRMLSLERSGRNPYLRSYAACTPRGAGHARGAVTYWFVNLSPTEPARLQLEQGAGADWYRVTAASLDASEVRLNGQRLRLDGGELPELAGAHESASGTAIAPASYAWAVVDADAPACR